MGEASSAALISATGTRDRLLGYATGSRWGLDMTLLRLARILGLGRGRLFLDGIPSRVHCFGAGPFLNLQSAREAGRLRSGDLYVMTASGLGSTFSAAVLRH